MDQIKSGNEIRQSFIDFFIEKGHTFVPSSSLVPGGDKTLLFTNAGMVQFKDVFLGIDKRPYKRAVNSQKCMRVAGKHNDLEDVGKDDRHHTFFEMLGNWSFGDYYKKEAISWAWELITRVWKIEPSRLWATVFRDEKGEIPTDEEAAEAWFAQPDFNHGHLIYLGRKENFWEMAETGPCGPCSEIHIDLGEEYCDKKNKPDHVCDIAHNCPRFLEFWNLVFVQYNRINESEFIPLPAKHVDTGMGLDRITSVLQGKNSNYMTDLLKPLMDVVMQLTGETEEQRAKNMTPYRVIADHARAATFLIGDGVVPGNIGRNYICRMIIRRGSRFGGKLGLNEPFLAKVAEQVIQNYGSAYPELLINRIAITENITREEKRFHTTIELGLSHLQEELDSLKQKNLKILSGQKAFELYATHGLPFEIARDIAREQELEIEEEGFRKAMDSHRINSGAGKELGEFGGEDSEIYTQILNKLINENMISEKGVAYDPYTTIQVEGKVLVLIRNGSEVKEVHEGDEVEVIISKTCFYVESGGQMADTGVIKSENGTKWEIQVKGVRKPIAGVIIHIGKVMTGNPRIGDQAIAKVDARRRKDIMRNHTATHLLQAQLRKILGNQVRQSGSLVAPDRLRFDFTYPEALNNEQLDLVEKGVNEAILEDHKILKEEKQLEKAINEGAMALFGEKYGSTVRTISIGDEEIISYELCGGTHVDDTGDIGMFIITSESSAAAGIRRIEAITGIKAYEKISSERKMTWKIAGKLSTTIDELSEKVDLILKDNERKAKSIEELNLIMIRGEYTERLIKDTIKIGNVALLITMLSRSSIEILRKLADDFRNENKTGIIVLGAIDSNTNNPLVLISITDDLIKSKGFDAVNLVKVAGNEIGGGGGGRAGLAQAGGNKPANLENALEKVRTIIQNKL